MHAGAPDEPLRLVLDTDIGSDVDDLLALTVVLGSPGLALAGVTTVYGDVLLRARMARRALTMANGPEVPVVPGRAETRSGREVWWGGHEGRLMPDLDRERVDTDLDAPALLAASPLVVAIGPLTNVAEAVETAGHRIERIVLMGGAFPGKPEHNIASDADAAAAVFGSGIPVTAIGIDQTERVRLDRAAADRIRATGPLGALIADEMRNFEEFLGHDYSVPHDPLAVLTLGRPGLFRTATGTVQVEQAGEEAGATRFRPHADGRHTVVTDVDVEAAAEEAVRRVLDGVGVAPGA